MVSYQLCYLLAITITIMVGLISTQCARCSRATGYKTQSEMESDKMGKTERDTERDTKIDGDLTPTRPDHPTL